MVSSLNHGSNTYKFNVLIGIDIYITMDLDHLSNKEVNQEEELGRADTNKHEIQGYYFSFHLLRLGNF